MVLVLDHSLLQKTSGAYDPEAGVLQAYTLRDLTIAIHRNGRKTRGFKEPQNRSLSFVGFRLSTQFMDYRLTITIPAASQILYAWDTQ